MSPLQETVHASRHQPSLGSLQRESEERAQVILQIVAESPKLSWNTIVAIELARSGIPNAFVNFDAIQGHQVVFATLSGTWYAANEDRYES